MIYDVIELVASVLGTNFTTDLTTLCTAKSVTAPTAIVGSVHKREDLLAWGTNPANLPGLGVISIRSVTGAKNQTKRDALTTVRVTYYTMGQDAAVLGAQVELAAEAILLSIDRVAGSGTGQVWGAGEARDSVLVEMLGTALTKDAGWFEDGVIVEFPCNDRDLV